MKRLNILVTGGAGYIGSKIAHDLIQSKFNVIVIDNLTTGYRFLIPKKAKFIKADILDYKKVEAIFKKNKIDSVIHLAASLSVEESQKKPLKYYLNNVLGLENMLRLVSEFQIKSFVLSSTCAIFGNSQKGAVQENSVQLPESNYGKTKIMGETLLINYAKKFKFQYAILRYFNVIGADKFLKTGPVKSPTLFKVLAKNITSNNHSIKIYGKDYSTKDGTCLRDFIDINDLSNLHLEALKKIKKLKKSIILNCGYGMPKTVLEIVNEFEKAINRKIKINYFPRRNGDVEKIYCNNQRLSKILKKWKPRFKLNESIKNQLRWEKKLKEYNVYTKKKSV